MKNGEILRKSYSQVFISSPDYDSLSLYAKRRAQMMESLDSLPLRTIISLEGLDTLTACILH